MVFFNLRNRMSLAWLFIVISVLVTVICVSCDTSDQVCIDQQQHNTTDTSITENITVKLPKGANPEGKPQEVTLASCEDRHQECIQFAKQGECTKNPGILLQLLLDVIYRLLNRMDDCLLC